MQVRPGYGETLPALLRRRYGIPERRTLAGIGVLAVLAIAGFLLLRDPFAGRVQQVHRGDPVFNTLYRPGLVRPVRARPGELQRYAARRGPVRAAIGIRALRLPAYRGDVSGVLPIEAVRHARGLAASLPGFEVLREGAAHLQKAPTYELAYRFGPRENPTTGLDVFVVPPDDPRPRGGVLISYRERQAGRPAGAAAPEVLKAARGTVRSFRFGTGRGG